MNRDDAERLVDAMMQYNDAGMLNEFGAVYAEIIAALCRKNNQPDGEGEYLLTVQVNVRRDTVNGSRDIMPRFAFNNNFTNYIYCKDIKGHWHKVKE